MVNKNTANNVNINWMVLNRVINNNYQVKRANYIRVFSEKKYFNKEKYIIL